MNIFTAKNARHLGVAHVQNHTAAPTLPHGACWWRLYNPVVTNAGSQCNNFTLHESHGLGTCPRTSYNKSELRGKSSTFLVSTHVLYIHNLPETAACSCRHKAAKGMTPFPTGGFEDETKCRQRGEKAKRKCHCYLVGLQGSDSSQTAEALDLKCYSISLFLIRNFPSFADYFSLT